MRNYRVLYRQGLGDAFKMGSLGRSHYVAASFSEALNQHLIAIDIPITRPYQFLVQDTQTLSARIFRIPTVVRAEEF